MPAFEKTIAVDSHEMVLRGTLPIAGSPFPGIVVIQHAPGVDEFILTVTERLAAAGYAALAPDLYHRLQDPEALGPLERMKQLTDREVIADANATVDYMLHDPAFDGRRIGIMGFCMGGRVAYMMAAENPNFVAAVVYYGGNIMIPWGDDVPSPFARTGQIHCPLLFHFGDDDTNPSPDDMRTLDQELTRLERPHEFHSYPNAGHAFMNFTSAERYREGSAQASWELTLGFLEKHLRS